MEWFLLQSALGRSFRHWFLNSTTYCCTLLTKRNVSYLVFRRREKDEHTAEIFNDTGRQVEIRVCRTTPTFQLLTRKERKRKAKSFKARPDRRTSLGKL